MHRKAARFVKQDYSKYKSVTRTIHKLELEANINFI